MEEKSHCLHFDRSHVERPSRVWGEYEGRERNGGKKDHDGSGDCSSNIVKSTVDAMHSEDKGWLYAAGATCPHRPPNTNRVTGVLPVRSLVKKGN